MKKRPQKSGQDHEYGFFALFTLTGGLLWMYAKRLMNIQTLASLEKKQGPGGCSRDIEDIMLDQALEKNPHQYHLDDREMAQRRFDSVLVVKTEPKTSGETNQQ